jgi:hypothetical protein
VAGVPEGVIRKNKMKEIETAEWMSIIKKRWHLKIYSQLLKEGENTTGGRENGIQNIHKETSCD